MAWMLAEKSAGYTVPREQQVAFGGKKDRRILWFGGGEVKTLVLRTGR
jgi:hypothetical protein